MVNLKPIISISIIERDGPSWLIYKPLVSIKVKAKQWVFIGRVQGRYQMPMLFT